MLSHRSAGGTVEAVIVETEAYAGTADPASHAFRGPTRRNAVMFGEPGRCYVYFIYGMHFCVNLVCQPAGQASAVLLRAGEVVLGADLATARRLAPRQPERGQPLAAGRAAGSPAGPPAAQFGTGRGGSGRGGTGTRAVAVAALGRGPASLCRALGIDASAGGADVCDPDSPLRLFAPGGADAGARQIRCGPRVGVRQAAELPWRFWIAGHPAVSPYRGYVPRRRGR